MFFCLAADGMVFGIVRGRHCFCALHLMALFLDWLRTGWFFGLAASFLALAVDCIVFWLSIGHRGIWAWQPMAWFFGLAADGIVFLALRRKA